MLIIGVMRNGLVLIGVSPFVQELMIGLVIIVAVGIDKWTHCQESQLTRRVKQVKKGRTTNETC